MNERANGRAIGLLTSGFIVILGHSAAVAVVAVVVVAAPAGLLDCRLANLAFTDVGRFS